MLEVYDGCEKWTSALAFSALRVQQLLPESEG
jgi:hypothetical protein